MGPGLTVGDWLAFDDGTDALYELVGGELVRRAPDSSRHGTIAQNAGDVIGRAADHRPPCRAAHRAALAVTAADGDRRGYIADVVMTCEAAADEQLHREPRLVAEVFPPLGAGGFDKRGKVRGYATLPTVEEIWLLDSRARIILTWRRVEGATWVGSFPYTGEDAFDSPVLGTRVELNQLYRNTGL